MEHSSPPEGLAWQVTTWNQMANLYATENTPRMVSVADCVIVHAALSKGGTSSTLVQEPVLSRSRLQLALAQVAMSSALILALKCWPTLAIRMA
jgi:hypothetical protein